MKRNVVTITHRTAKELGWPLHYPTTFNISINGECITVGDWRNAVWTINYEKRRGAKIKGLRRLRN